MKIIYEGTISGYNFIMVDENTIEVWSDFDNALPISYIYLRDGEVKTEKEFHYSISDWFMKNVG